MYRNRGDGTFENVARKLGLQAPIESFTTWFWDYDNDGVLDLYVSTYHQGTDNFGTRYRHAPVVADYLGLESRRYGVEPPRLFRGDGAGGFTEVSEELGVDLITLTMGANFGDLDNDGFLDFYLGTGYPDYDGVDARTSCGGTGAASASSTSPSPAASAWCRRGTAWPSVTSTTTAIRTSSSRWAGPIPETASATSCSRTRASATTG